MSNITIETDAPAADAQPSETKPRKAAKIRRQQTRHRPNAITRSNWSPRLNATQDRGRIFLGDHNAWICSSR